MKNIARLAIYPLILAATLWAFILPTGQTSHSGLYAGAPRPIHITGPHPHATILVPLVLEQPKPPGAEFIHELTHRGTWRPGLDLAPDHISTEEAVNIVAQWTYVKQYAYTATGSNAALVEHHNERNVGASFGLAAALAAYDTLTPDPLTTHTVAATGTVTPTGQVGPIGGINAKIEGVNDTDATVFFIPADNVKHVTVPSNVTLVPVTTVADAIEWLNTHP